MSPLTSLQGIPASLARLFKRIGPQRTAGLAMLVFLFLFLLRTGLAPVRLARELRDLSEADSLFMSQYDPIYDHPEISGLVRNRAYLKAKTELLMHDSIQMVIHMPDSLVFLTINGVTLHASKAGFVKNDRFLEKLPGREYNKLYASPLRVLEQRATIVKEPVVIRHAPKDSDEALQNAYLPDTLIQKPAFLQLRLEHGIDLILEQEANPSLRDICFRVWFHARIKGDRLLRNMGNCLTLRNQQYTPTVVIRLSAHDLRAIYRALPANAMVVIKY